MQSPLHLRGDDCWPSQLLHSLFQGLLMVLCPRLLTLEPLALLWEATLPGFLLALGVLFEVSHGRLLRFGASPGLLLGGNHDPFFMSIQGLS
jgi:hypothetical protein